MCVDEDLRKRGHFGCHEVEKGIAGRRYILWESLHVRRHMGPQQVPNVLVAFTSESDTIRAMFRE